MIYKVPYGCAMVVLQANKPKAAIMILLYGKILFIVLIMSVHTRPVHQSFNIPHTITI